ncbi:hypothetical protein ASE17_09310 [Phenylobacterium sp. Root77]|uniref:hypothetical protein n=1 Tax=unclassified Phenylobacterium TaxID=2640670 RepID=UPI0006F956D9|nr:MULTISPECIES: hypothetical protein [unclassified Phenylobacterium]KQW73137.1 hypothetical protein ASC73_01880 [Phenylobacterium sp. Root1277]KQW92356.1 hypothetical protein ASC79_12590 [Phenylobacterium sp. Root1290]KRC40587.1 hypothetical protein ASE17_09310 [Phenylobacterium sp. Root77]
MLDFDADKEISFASDLFVRFSHDDRGVASGLIDEARSISFNACCCVLNEICRPAIPGKVAPGRQLELLDEWAKGIEHPLKEAVLRCAVALINAEPLSYEACRRLMDDIARYDGQRAALGLAYFAGDPDDQEGDVRLQSHLEAVTKQWADRGV